MDVTISLDEELVRQAQKIAADRNTTLAGMVRDFLEKLAKESDPVRDERNHEALRKTFAEIQYRLGKRSWKREDLHDRG